WSVRSQPDVRDGRDAGETQAARALKAGAGPMTSLSRARASVGGFIRRAGVLVCRPEEMVMASGQFARLALASLFAFATGSCATIDSTPDAPSVAQSDRATAARSHPQILQQFGGAVEGPLATYVSSVGERVATA